MNASTSVARSSNLPFVINNYIFTQLIGKGGFAEVYLVKHDRFNTEFVAKVMTIDPCEKDKMWAIFDAEASALSSLNHPNIIRLYERFQHNSQFFFILEYCPCGSLHDELAATGVLSYDRFVKIAGQLVRALHFCHSKGIAHRDIKPGNILFDCNRRAKLADFGLSLRTQMGQLYKTFSGSCVYTAPEIFLRKPHDPMKGDIWALGVVFAMMATGSSPWKCDSIGGLRQLAQNGQYTLNKGVPPVIAELISRMIVVEPSNRITMDELVKHPIFKQQGEKARISMQASSPWVKLRWDNITPPQDDDFRGDSEPQFKRNKILAASSSFLHQIPSCKKVKRRCLIPLALQTFNTVEDFVTDLQ